MTVVIVIITLYFWSSSERWAGEHQVLRHLQLMPDGLTLKLMLAWPSFWQPEWPSIRV
jgi:hypothetical protein